MAITIRDSDATKSYIDARWAANPRLNPAAFREVLGHTTGKLWLDLRGYMPREAALQTAWENGLNAWLLSPHTLASLKLPQGIARETLVVALDSTEPTPPEQPVDLFFLRTDQPDAAGLAALEQALKDNLLAVYGLAAEQPLPLHQILTLAEDAAQQIWSRRKRPGLRALLAPLNFTETAWLHQPTTRHHDESISPLEYAARLGWAVVADQAASLRRPDGLRVRLTDPLPSPTAALAALAEATAAEQALHADLGGWPTVAGQPLFSLLAHLGAGDPPFASAEIGLKWATFVLPDILLALQKLPPATTTAPYMASLQRLAFHARSLGQLAAAQATHKLLAALPPLPAGRVPLQAANLVTSLPGVAGALVTPENLATHLPAMTAADHPDPAPFFI